MSTKTARRSVIDALRAAGLRTAEIPASVQPPCAYVVTYGAREESSTLESGNHAELTVWWIPVRGLSDPDGTDDALDSALAAIGPLSTSAVGFTLSALPYDDSGASWPAWRAELTLPTPIP